MSKKKHLKVKKTFFKKGTCSRTFFYLLNREFGNAMEFEEEAIDPLAGGITQQGYQCGMLWGASMAMAAESYRKNEELGIAIGQTINATRTLLESFKELTGTIECEEITDTDFSKKWQMARYLLTGKFLSCYFLADKWAYEAVDTAKAALLKDTSNISEKTVSCTSEVIKKMGGSEREMALVAGFAGGLGLSGSGCGVLAAVIWKRIFELIKKGEWKSTFPEPVSAELLRKFYELTDYEIECREICGKSFSNIEEHTEFVENGGCRELIDKLAEINGTLNRSLLKITDNNYNKNNNKNSEKEIP